MEKLVAPGVGTKLKNRMYGTPMVVSRVESTMRRRWFGLFGAYREIEQIWVKATPRTEHGPFTYNQLMRLFDVE